MTKAKGSNQKSKTKNQKSPNRKLVWTITIASLLIAAGLFYWINTSDSESTMQSSENGTSSTELSKALVRANQLTEKVFYYVEMVETKQLTQAEADKESGPIKVELQQIRSKLSEEELVYNDSIRKAYGNVMVNKVMKWRMDNGLIKPDTIWPKGK